MMERKHTPSQIEEKSRKSLPDTEISEILGLVELLISKGGKEDIYKLAAELSMEYGETLAVITGAELLGLVHTPGGDVEITPLGDKVSRASINDRKKLICDQMEKIPVFHKVSEYLKSREDRSATRDDILEKLVELLPNEDAESSFSTLIEWARYAELFGYNDDSNMFYLDLG